MPWLYLTPPLNLNTSIRYGSSHGNDTRTTASGLIYEKILTISESTTNNHKPPITKFEAGDSVLYRISPTTIRMAEFVKAEYPPVDQIFETVTTPSPSLESSEA